ncbi:YjjG family noncanonical pyrimidine nucleotidase [Sporolactobacillus spathodeae]|uniref:2-haloacid dehalogenase n=1 Tax=Sporolactobacillus spathodeae TaxID=1465502 RepID=A0ABS2QAP6_9BACL|nr:YjjG family noncanonical pyrimidine nucleotidase [Sporolactobacillus spathodeae]MBM7658047.1 2-haloacid dehalogenase [Sporolactobacillus spathodeae]
MKAYKALFFDVDDTLLDFHAAEEGALHLLFDEQGIPLTADIHAQYQSYNRTIWQKIETGAADRQTLLSNRFAGFFNAFGLSVDGPALEGRYQQLLSESHQLIDGAWNVLTALKKSYPLYIVTNGVSKTQYRRLRDSRLDTLFEAIFVSEDAGAQKPSAEFFNYVFDQLDPIQPERGLIIGDSLSSDIRGGINSGMDTCWFNPNHQAQNAVITPSYEIDQLRDLLPILSKQPIPQSK